MKRILYLSVTFMVFFATQAFSQSQSYNNALGIRIGSYNGLNYKTFLDSQNALDFNLSFKNNNSSKRFFFTALYEVHNPLDIPEFPGLRWYYGAGASLGSVKYEPYDGDLYLSIDGVIGLDYKFVDAPINLSLDFRPRVEVVPNTNLRANDLGLAIRYTF